jgi:hypothetical protein
MDMTSLDAAFAVNYSMAIVGKMMDTEELAGQEMSRMLDEVSAPAQGAYIDTYA